MARAYPRHHATVLIFAWNEFFSVANLTPRQASPLAVYLSTFRAAQGTLFIARISAVVTAAITPILIAGWVAQDS